MHCVCVLKVMGVRSLCVYVSACVIILSIFLCCFNWKSFCGKWKHFNWRVVLIPRWRWLSVRTLSTERVTVRLCKELVCGLFSHNSLKLGLWDNTALWAMKNLSSPLPLPTCQVIIGIHVCPDSCNSLWVYTGSWKRWVKFASGE